MTFAFSTISLRTRLLLAFLVLYLPYFWVVFRGAGLVAYWPVLPYVSLGSLGGLVPFSLPFPEPWRSQLVLFFPLAALAGFLYGMVHIRKYFWPFFLVMCGLSAVLGWVGYCLAKA